MDETLFINWMKRRMAETGITQAQLGKAVGLTSQSAVSNILLGKRRIKLDERAAIERALSASPDENEFLSPGPTLFIKGQVQAGYFADSWEVPEDEWERYTGRADIAVPTSRRFGLRVVGDSMNEVYPPGTILDCVVWEGHEPIPNGKRVIVRRKQYGDGVETTVKEYRRGVDGIEWLVPRSNNPAFQAPFRCDRPGDDIERIEIIAVVVAAIIPE